MPNGQQSTHNNTKDNSPRKDDSKDKGEQAGKTPDPQRDNKSAPEPNKGDGKKTGK